MCRFRSGIFLQYAGAHRPSIHVPPVIRGLAWGRSAIPAADTRKAPRLIEGLLA
jgi:hypothetical protein